MVGKHVGYIRVSSVDQNSARQLANIHLDKVFEDRCSGKNTDRPKLKECLNYLREDDVLHVHSIDRLARNLKDLLDITTDLTNRSVTVIFHKENLIFDGSQSPIQKTMFQIMGAVYELERNMIKERQLEGIAIAKAAGKYQGRKPILSDNQVREIKQLIEAKFSIKHVAKKFGVSRGTIYNVLKSVDSDNK